MENFIFSAMKNITQYSDEKMFNGHKVTTDR